MSEAVREIARDVIAEELAVEPDEDGRIHLRETHVRFGAAAVGTAAAGLTLKQLGAIGYAAAQQGAGAGSIGTEEHPLAEIHASTVDRQTDVIDTDALSIDGNELVLDVNASVPNDAQNVRVRSDVIEIADGSNWDPAMAEWYGGSSWGGAVVERYNGSSWTQLYPEPAIPDSGVTRPADNRTSVDDGGTKGIRFTSDVVWPEIGGRISSNTSGATRAYIYRVSDGALIGDADISGKSSGDAFTIDLSEDIGDDGEEYNFVIDGEGTTINFGFYDNPSFPYNSSDGNLSIINGAGSASITLSNPHSISEIGDVGF